MIWRNDDISYLTDLKEFKKTHELFNQYKAKHTIALIAEHIEKSPELIAFIKSQKNIEVQLHCWEHIDFTLNHAVLFEQLEKGVQKLTELFSKPTILFPPWNKADYKVNQFAHRLGLRVSNNKISLSQYVKANGDVMEDVVNFHSWHYPDAMLLESALRIYNTKRGISK